MKAIKTETANAVFVKEGCYDLPGTRFAYADGTPGIETCFEFTPEELEQINKTGRIYLYMLGTTVPPLYLSTTSDVELVESTEDKPDEN